MHRTNRTDLRRVPRRLVVTAAAVAVLAVTALPGKLLLTAARATSAPTGLDSVTGLIAYTRGNGGNWDVYGSDARGDGEVQVTDSSDIEFDPRWSRDAREIAFHTREESVSIWRMPFAGGTPTAVVDRIIGDYWAGFPAWSPGDDCISFSGSHSSYDGRTDLKVWCTDGTVKTLAATDERNESGSDWAPDGSHVTYEAEPVSGQGGAFYWGIWAVDADGSNDRVVVDWENTSERHPRWAPTGEMLAFVSYPNAFGLGAGSLYLMDAATGLVTEVLRSSAAGPSAWSPDGTQLVTTAIKDNGPQPVGDFRLVGPVAPGERKGLYLVDLTARTIERLHGAAGGEGARPGMFEWGYGPDWTSGTATTMPTPTPTSTVTATTPALPSATPTRVPINFLPLAQRHFVVDAPTTKPTTPAPPSATPAPVLENFLPLAQRHHAVEAPTTRPTTPTATEPPPPTRIPEATVTE